MQQLQQWFEPLLWTIGVIMALVGFYQAVIRPINKGIKKTVDVHKEIQDSFNTIRNDIEAVSDKLSSVQNDVAALKAKHEQSDGIQLSIIRDRILDIYLRNCKSDTISMEELETVNDLYMSYQALGGNSFISHLMEDLNKKTAHPL